MPYLIYAKAKDGGAAHDQSAAGKENRHFSRDGVARTAQASGEAVVKHRKKAEYLRYSKEIPEKRAQLEVAEIRHGACRFTLTETAHI